MKSRQTTILLVVVTMLLCVEQSRSSKCTNPLSGSRAVELRQVMVMHRHGDRTPIYLFSKDLHADPRYWPEGWGQLTTAGKQRMLALGRFVRRRYARLLTGDPLQVEARSSALTRCLESAKWLLEGAYPLASRSGRAITVTALPLTCDPMLGSTSSCPAAMQEVQQVYKSKNVSDFLESKKPLIEFVSKAIGENVSDLDSIAFVYENLLIKQDRGYSLPNWATADIMSELESVSDAVFLIGSSTSKLQRLTAGVFLKHLRCLLTLPLDSTGSSDEKECGDGHPKRLHLFSASDGTLVALLQALAVYDKKRPLFGASVIMENWVNGTENEVRFFYLRNTLTEEVELLRVRRCEDREFCPFTRLLQSMKPFLLEDWERECDVQNYSHDCM